MKEITVICDVCGKKVVKDVSFDNANMTFYLDSGQGNWCRFEGDLCSDCASKVYAYLQSLGVKFTKL